MSSRIRRADMYPETERHMSSQVRTAGITGNYYSCGCAESFDGTEVYLCSYHDGMEHGIEVCEERVRDQQ